MIYRLDGNPQRHFVVVFQNVTRSFGAAISGLGRSHLTERVISRSKRMMLDTLGVGLIGTRTDVYNKALQYSQVDTSILGPSPGTACHMGCIMKCISRKIAKL